MHRTVALAALCCALAAARPSPAQEPKDLDVAFGEAVEALIAGDGKTAAAAFGELVEGRWEELSPRGRHGASTLLMFALLLEGREADACARGAKLREAMPEVFYRLGKEGGPEVARALSVLSLRTGKGGGVLYLHNASDRDVAVEGTRYELSYGFKSASTSVDQMTTDGSPAFPGPLVVPAGKGVIVTSAKGEGQGLLALAAADVVCVLAAQAKTLQPDWIYLTLEDYAQTLARLRIVAGKVRWGEQALEDVVLLDFTAEEPAKAEAPAKAEEPAKAEGR